MHVGYCISAYGKAGYVFSVPISTAREELRLIVPRKFMINGEPLTEKEFLDIRKHVIGDVEVGWDNSLNYYLEGHNIPQDDSEWI